MIAKKEVRTFDDLHKEWGSSATREIALEIKSKEYVELSTVERLKQELKDILCTEKYCESGREKHQCPNCFYIEKVFGVEGEE